MSMNNQPSENVKEILLSASKSQDLLDEFKYSLPERYKMFLINYFEYYKKKQYKNAKFFLTTLELILTAIGAALGFFFIYYETNNVVQYVVWIAYILVFVCVGLTNKLIPTDENILYLEGVKIKLLNLTERLATEVALFSLLDQTTVKDDYTVIEKISKFVPEINEMSPEANLVIDSSLKTTQAISNPRDTNIIISQMKIEPSIIDQLNDAIKQIVELSGNIFEGRDFSAKLYLRVIKVKDSKEVEFLVPFARYAPQTDSSRKPFGSSWVKARGNPAVVWESLEKGSSIHEVNNDSFSYYKSLFSICLPGRIGVLALTSNHENAFIDKQDNWAVKSLALSSRIIFLRLLKIND